MRMADRFAGRTAIVTGAGVGGLGAAYAGSVSSPRLDVVPETVVLFGESLVCRSIRRVHCLSLRLPQLRRPATRLPDGPKFVAAELPALEGVRNRS